jgi:hypothetical protein
MKAGRPHRVSAHQPVRGILDEAEKVRCGPFIFSNARGDAPLSEPALEMLMRRLNAKPATVHGFRSAFGTGRVMPRIHPERSARKPWRTRSVIPRNWPTAATPWRNGGP